MSRSQASYFLTAEYRQRFQRVRYHVAPIATPKSKTTTFPWWAAVAIAIVLAGIILFAVEWVSQRATYSDNEASATLPSFSATQYGPEGEKPFASIRLQGRPLAILYWSPQHPDSIESLRWFVSFENRLARENKPHQFVAILTDGSPSEASDLLKSFGAAKLIHLHTRESAPPDNPSVLSSRSAGQFLLFDAFGALEKQGDSSTQLGLSLEGFRSLGE